MVKVGFDVRVDVISNFFAMAIFIARESKLFSKTVLPNFRENARRVTIKKSAYYISISIDIVCVCVCFFFAYVF